MHKECWLQEACFSAQWGHWWLNTRPTVSNNYLGHSGPVTNKDNVKCLKWKFQTKLSLCVKKMKPDMTCRPLWERKKMMIIQLTHIEEKDSANMITVCTNFGRHLLFVCFGCDLKWL